MTFYELSVPGLPESVFLVPDDEADAWRAKAKNPGRVWSPSEIAILKASGATREEVLVIAEQKMLVYAKVLWTRPGKAEREADAREAEQLRMIE